MDLCLVQHIREAVAAIEGDEECVLASDLDGNPVQAWHPVAQFDLPIGLLPQHFAPRVLGVELGRSEVASINMNTNPFFFFFFFA